MLRIQSFALTCLAIVGLLNASLVFGQSRGSAEYLDGLGALTNGNVTDALAAFDKAVAADDENSSYHTAKGIALYLSEKFDPAVDEFERSNKLGKTPATDLWGWANGMIQVQPPPDDLDPATRARIYQSRKKSSYDTRPPYESKEPYARAFINAATAFTNAEAHNTPQKEQVKQQLLQYAAAYAWNEMSGPTLAPFLMTRVKSLFDQKKYPECLVLIDHIRANNADDPNLLFYSASCKASAGDNEAARTEFTMVLKQWSQHAPSFLGRARVAAKMGAIERANSDLASAASIDPKATASVRVEISKELEDASAQLPKESQPELLATLKKAVADGEPLKALVDKAERLERAATAARFITAEFYTQERQRLEAVATADPKNADKQAALAEFLVTPTVMRPVRIPGQTGMTRINVGDPDIPHAMTAINAALAINPKHINALTQGALAAVISKQADNAIQWVQRAFDAKGTNLDLCKTWLDYYTNEANDLSSRASYLRQPKTHTEFRGDGEYLVTVYPSPADLAQATELDRQSAELRRKAAAPLQQLIELKKGTIEGQLAIAEFDGWSGKYDDAVAAANAALKMDPWNLDAHEFLIDLCPKINMMDVAVEHQDLLNNLINASAGRTLDKVWKLLADTKYRSARETLDTAEKIDPAQARIPAYRASIATADKNVDEVISASKQALAMEQARERVNGRSLDINSQSQLGADDVGLAMVVGNIYGGALAAQSKFNDAVQSYREVVVLGNRLPANIWDTPMQSSALPTEQNQKNSGWTPREMMNDASHQAAVAFYNAGRAEDAARALMAWIQVNGKVDLPQGAQDFGYEIYKKLGPQKSAQYFTANMMGYYQMKDGQAANQAIFDRSNQIRDKYTAKLEDIQKQRQSITQQMQQLQMTRGSSQQFNQLQAQLQQLDREFSQTMMQMNQEQMQNTNSAYQQPQQQQPQQYQLPPRRLGGQ